ncbi:MAG: GNAT family N-acetyltransferase [Chloroflexi bacterium]|nr:GNAT family N-acetyltransferase [Chloroflexota bacterium]
MSDQQLAPLAFREAQEADWEQIAPMVANTWGDEGDYINESLWRQWVEESATPRSYITVAENDGQIVALGRIRELSVGEWWMEGIRVRPELRGQGIGQAVVQELIRLHRLYSIGLLRFATYSHNTGMPEIAKKLGFVHLLSATEIHIPAMDTDYSAYRVLEPRNVDIAFNFLKASPMYRFNKFAEYHWVMHFMSRERVLNYLEDETTHVVGWRQFKQLYGMVIVHTQSDPAYPYADPDNLYLSYVAAPDDTTFANMIHGLRGIAAAQGKKKIVWKMPLGAGLERPIAQQADIERAWSEDGQLLLYELPIQAGRGI